MTYKMFVLSLIAFVSGPILVVILALFLESRNHYKVGDCVADGDHHLHQIVKIGDRGGFLLKDPVDCRVEIWNSTDGGLTLTDCFDSFNKCQ